MEIRLLEDNSREQFNSFVANHARGTFLQSWQWGEFQKSLHKQVRRFFIYEQNEIIASAQVITNSTSLGTYNYCAYGPLWKEGLSEQDTAKALRLFVTTVNKDSQLFTRIEPTQQFDFTSIGGKKTDPIQPSETLLLNIAQPEQELLATFHTKTRYNIKVAEKHNVQVQTFSEVNQQVIDLIMQTSERQGYRNHTRAYITQLWEFLAATSELTATGYLASINESPAASGLMIDFGKTRTYLFGGSDYEQRKYMAPYLMHWQAIKDAKQLGLSFYDFGASETASGHVGGYMKFKMGFIPAITTFGGSYDFPINRWWYTIYTVVRKLNRAMLHLK